MWGLKVHHSSFVHRRVRFFSFGNFSVAENSSVNAGCYIDNRHRVTIGKSVSIAHDVRIYTMGHDVDSREFKQKGAPVVIEDYVCIFAAAMVMPGVTVGRGAVVFPGAVVTKSVPPYAVVGGNPARVLRSRHADLDYKIDTGFWLMT